MSDFPAPTYLELADVFSHPYAMRWVNFAAIFSAIVIAGCLGVCWRANADGGRSRADVNAQVRAMTELGRALFSDPALSASGKLSCASCHDPAHAFGPANDLPVQLGGADLQQPGLRATPSLRYLQSVPQFDEHYFDSDEEGDPSVDNGPTGGLTWDGRVDRGRDQARLPLLSPLEMANPDEASVVTAVRRSPRAAELREIFGADIFDDKAKAFAAIVEALEAFEQSTADFYPYTS